mgnify:FL=1
MTEPDGKWTTIRPWPPEVTGQQAMVAVLAALVDLFLTMQDLPGSVDLQLRQLRTELVPAGDPRRVMQDALTLSAICEVAKRNQGR